MESDERMAGQQQAVASHHLQHNSVVAATRTLPPQYPHAHAHKQQQQMVVMAELNSPAPYNAAAQGKLAFWGKACIAPHAACVSHHFLAITHVQQGNL
jgi:hypothetical protein